MRWSSLAARLRRPATVTASVAMVAAASFPTGVRPAAEAPTVRRVVATPVPVPVFTPVRLEIPKIDLDAPIVPVGTLRDGTMGAPSTAEDVGWWFGRKPGKGNVLLDGHHDWNRRQGSFFFLYKLEKGDEITIRGKGKKALTYRVTWIKAYDRAIDATDLLGNKHGQVATLITCTGPFDLAAGTREQRLVARAQLVST